MTLRRDAIARQTSAWLFTLSEDENLIFAELVDRVRKAVPQYGHVDIRTDKRDFIKERAAEVFDSMFYAGLEWLKRHVARVDAIDSAPAATVVPHDGERTHGGNFCQGGETVDAPARQRAPNNDRQDTGAPRPVEFVRHAGSTPAPDTSAAGRHGAQRDAVTPLDPGHETPTGGDSCGVRQSVNVDPVAIPIRDDVFEDGYWRSCSGCHESDEGLATGPYSETLRCNLGSGCYECGGIGATWERFDDQPAWDDATPTPDLNSAEMWRAEATDRKFDDSEGGK